MYKTGQSIDYIFGTYQKICTQTNNECQWCNCLHFHNNIKTNSVHDCNHVDIRLHGLTMRQVTLIAMFFRYYDYEFLLNSKQQLVDVMNGILSKEHTELNQKNTYTAPLLSTLFLDNENVSIDESSNITKTISDIIYTNDYNEKQVLFNKVRKTVSSNFSDKNHTFFQFMHYLAFAFEDFFKDSSITNNILKTQDDKILLIHVLLNIFKIMSIFPNHVKHYNSKDSITAINVRMKANQLDGKVTNYLEGDYDDGRLHDYKSDNGVTNYIASIDSYYYIYKKFGINNKNLFILFEIYDYIDDLVEKANQSKEMINLFGEFKSIIMSICKVNFSIDIDNLF